MRKPAQLNSPEIDGKDHRPHDQPQRDPREIRARQRGKDEGDIPTGVICENLVDTLVEADSLLRGGKARQQ